jgi:hypothetical protein
VTVPSFPFEYREDVAPIGRRVRAYDTLDRFRRGVTPVGIASNTEALRGRSVTARFRARSLPGEPVAESGPALGGTTGLIDIPVPYVTPEGTLHVGYSHIPEKWSYEGRPTLKNDYWYLTVGMLPWLETSIRATVLPGEYLIDDVPVDAVDRMGSLRIQSPGQRVEPPWGPELMTSGAQDAFIPYISLEHNRLSPISPVWASKWSQDMDCTAYPLPAIFLMVPLEVSACDSLPGPSRWPNMTARNGTVDFASLRFPACQPSWQC